ncbi:MAG: tetratricopeptide repeat protein [Bacteroidetes bacterium]|jgi:Tfp pilus assembly protein PilF|nr:tetratricopeptide repeat protein [Bacteroidota bacterium]
MNRYFQNAQFLYQQSRLPEAEAELKKALSEDPNDPYSLGLFAACRMGQRDWIQAIEHAEKAVSLQPYNANLFYILARAYFFNQDIPKAKQAIDEGQRIDPNEAGFFGLKAEIEFYQDNWELALEEVDRGLELDAENVDLVNLRARCLVKLNRQEEASQTLDYALNKAPENTYSHANKGWVAIEKDQYDQAIEHFKEALRFDPNNGYARSGLKEAIKGKNYLYRGVLKYFLWMDKMQEQYKWGFVIGIYILYRVMLWAYEAIPVLAPILLPLIIFYVIFAFSTWIAGPISNLFLRAHPLGKNALDKDEIIGSNIVGALGAACLVSLGIYFFNNEPFYMYLGGYFGLLMIPAGGLFGVGEGTKARRYMTLYALGLGVIGGLWFFYPHLDQLVYIFALGIFFFSWVANYFMMLDAKRF